MYITHYDFLYGRWNVFHVVDGRENFICSFANLDDANDFCAINNGANVSVGGER